VETNIRTESEEIVSAEEGEENEYGLNGDEGHVGCFTFMKSVASSHNIMSGCNIQIAASTFVWNQYRQDITVVHEFQRLLTFTDLL
jgi:hypothetical protein